MANTVPVWPVLYRSWPLLYRYGQYCTGLGQYWPNTGQTLAKQRPKGLESADVLNGPEILVEAGYSLVILIPFQNIKST